ncbi:hypothetical protein BCON_0340g00010 [Botryotinia convoluta]|uniref:Uncharacterized protein n=1 Tax=Botryotinia convoluta TaxID=54673 RepID=A0A4Z1HAI6_9HELO|nr:hypothetical protein BCON_0340g00010 [Botryotinia convoluta]
MEYRTNAPEYSDTKESPLSPPSNLEAIDSSDNIPSPISNLINDENVQRPHCSGPCTTSRRSEPSNPTENTINSSAESTTRLEKHQHPPRESKNRTPNPCNPSPSPAEPNSDSASQTPSEHSSGSDAAFYCSVGSTSEDEEDGLINSLGRGAEIGVEGESGLMKRTLREAVSTSGTDSGGAGEDDEEEEEEEEGEEEENEIHNNNSKRRKSKKRFTFLKRLFGRKKSGDNDRGAGGIG